MHTCQSLHDLHFYFFTKKTIVQALASLLVGDSSLSSLFLKANLIGDEGARAFKVVLLHSQALTTWVFGGMLCGVEFIGLLRRLLFVGWRG